MLEVRLRFQVFMTKVDDGRGMQLLWRILGCWLEDDLLE